MEAINVVLKHYAGYIAKLSLREPYGEYGNPHAPFIILDEPTAALDPIAEAEIYGKFDEIAGDKTAIYISHRLSSCKFCDEIAVFHEGAVIQQGSHASLVADTNGKYYELWHAQAQYYTETA